MKLRFITAVTAVMLIGGCAAPSNVKPIFVPSQIIHTPSLNIEAEAEVGQTVVSRSNLKVFPAVSVAQDISEFIKQNPLNNRWSGTTTIHAGTFKKTSENTDGSFFPDPNGTFEYFARTLKCVCGVFVPHDPTKPPVLYLYHTVGTAGFEFGVTPITATKTTHEVWGTDSLKKELIYGGLSQKTIAMSYREFADGTARPAFTQELKYDLSEGDAIGFRGARFQVIKATNTSIRYKVLKPLD